MTVDTNKDGFKVHTKHAYLHFQLDMCIIRNKRKYLKTKKKGFTNRYRKN